MNQINKDHDFLLEIMDEKGKSVHQELVQDYHIARIIGDATFLAICAGHLPNDPQITSCLEATISPVFKEAEEAHSPYIGGIEVLLRICNEKEDAYSYRKSYGLNPFWMVAKDLLYREILRPVIDQKKEHEGETEEDDTLHHYSCIVSAFKKTRSSPVKDPFRSDGTLSLETGAQVELKKMFRGVAVSQKPFPILHGQPSNFDIVLPKKKAEDPYHVFIPEDVIEDVITQTIQANGLEQAGFLIGYLFKDPETSRAYLVVTGQIPANEGVVAEPHSFTFTPDAFLAAKGILDLRKGNEVIVGWFHNHHWCPGCPYNKISGSSIFFSFADENVHSSAFSQPFQVALVAGRDLSLDATRPAVKLYGWKDAAITEYEFSRFQMSRDQALQFGA